MSHSKYSLFRRDRTNGLLENLKQENKSFTT